VINPAPTPRVSRRVPPVPREVVTGWPSGITAAGLAVVSAADAPAQRTALGLGSAAVESDAAYADASHTHALTDITSGVRLVALSADRTNDNATPNTIADVAGLSFAVVSGSTYWFRAAIPFTAAAGTTGSRWSMNGPATTLLRYRVVVPTSATAEAVTHAAAYDEPAACTSDSPTSGLVVIEGIVLPSASGTLAVRFASEVGGSAIVAKAGATLHWQQVA